MTEPFLGEIQIFGFDYPPVHWANCDGSLLAIRQNTALFALIGVYYGGDGVLTFALPNLAHRAACSQGTGPGLSPRAVGDVFGEDAVTLTSDQMPAHLHTLNTYATRASTSKIGSPTPGAAITSPGTTQAFVPGQTPDTTFFPGMLSVSGANGAHENRQPLLALDFCIALEGVFPSFG